MSKRTIPEVLTESVREHPAVQAWLQVQSDSVEPDSLELVQRRRHSTVYRLNQGKGIARESLPRGVARQQHVLNARFTKTCCRSPGCLRYVAMDCWKSQKENMAGFSWKMPRVLG